MHADLYNTFLFNFPHKGEKLGTKFKNFLHFSQDVTFTAVINQEVLYCNKEDEYIKEVILFILIIAFMEEQ